ncbi:hypothetical protein ZWY2020_016825 [Hordeum vulgare]|nr:hypothetical protein ZWY2020_016825 [Hordeum vulgare]
MTWPPPLPPTVAAAGVEEAATPGHRTQQSDGGGGEIRQIRSGPVRPHAGRHRSAAAMDRAKRRQAPSLKTKKAARQERGRWWRGSRPDPGMARRALRREGKEPTHRRHPWARRGFDGRPSGSGATGCGGGGGDLRWRCWFPPCRQTRATQESSS